MKKFAVLFFAVLTMGFAILATAPTASAKSAPDEALEDILFSRFTELRSQDE